MLAFNMEIVGRAVQILVGFLTGLLRQPAKTYEQRTFLAPKGGSMCRAVSKSHQAGCIFCDGVGKGQDVTPLIRSRAN